MALIGRAEMPVRLRRGRDHGTENPLFSSAFAPGRSL